MKKKRIAVLIVVLIVLIPIICVIVSIEKNTIKGEMVQNNALTGAVETTKLEMKYQHDLPYEMVLKVECGNKEVADTSYDAMNKIVKAILKENPKDSTKLERSDTGYKLTTNINSKGFTYPKELSKEDMKKYLVEEGWNIK